MAGGDYGRNSVNEALSGSNHLSGYLGGLENSQLKRKARNAQEIDLLGGRCICCGRAP